MKPPYKKIIYGITKSNFGGAQRYVFDLALGAKEAGVDVAVLCGGNGLLIQKLQENSIRTALLPSLQRDISIMNDWQSFIFMCHFLKNERPDVFHVNSSKMGLGVLAGRVVGTKKVIFTMHGFPWKENRPLLQKFLIKILMWSTIMLSHKTICVAEKVKDELSEWPLIKSKLFVIHSGVDSFEMLSRSEARERLIPQIQEETLLVGTTSELHRIKGLDILIRAWANFTQKHIAKLVIIGEGEEKQNLQNLTRELGVEDSVHFLGFIDNARSLLKGLDIFVLPSRSEAWPYSLLESGHASLPVIATGVGGVPEIIKNEVSGMLIPNEKVEKLGDTLTYLADNKEKRKIFGENLNKKVLKDFSLHQMVRDTLETYV